MTMTQVEVVEVRQRWASYEQAAKYTSLDERTLRRLAAAGKIRTSRPGGKHGRVVLDLHSLDQLLESADVTPANAG